MRSGRGVSAGRPVRQCHSLGHPSGELPCPHILALHQQVQQHLVRDHGQPRHRRQSQGGVHLQRLREILRPDPLADRPAASRTARAPGTAFRPVRTTLPSAVTEHRREGRAVPPHRVGRARSVLGQGLTSAHGGEPSRAVLKRGEITSWLDARHALRRRASAARARARGRSTHGPAPASATNAVATESAADATARATHPAGRPD